MRAASLMRCAVSAVPLMRCVFQELPTGSIYNYVLSVEQSLGALTFLRIWHDNTGKGKKRSWHLGQIIFTDLQTNEK